MTSLVQKATSQHGLLTTKQLRAEGITKSMQAHLRRIAMLYPEHPGVLRLGGAPETWHQRLLAAILAPGSQTVASHRSALRLWGLNTRSDCVEVTVRYPSDKTLKGVIVHREGDLDPIDLTEVDGISVTTVARTLCDAGVVFSAREVQRLVDHAVATGLVKVRELIEVRRRLGEHGRTGVVKLDLAIDGVLRSAGSESGPELQLARVLRQASLPAPIKQYVVVVAGRQYRLDLAYPKVRLGLEYDGVDAHTRVDGFEQDRVRQNDLVGAGWTILRFTHRDLRDRPGSIIAHVRRHLRSVPKPSKTPDL